MTKRKRYNSNLQSTYCADCEAASNHEPLEEILPKTKGKISSPYKSKVKQTFGELEAKAVIKKKCEGPDCYNNNPFEQDKGALSINAMYKTNCGDTPCHEFPSPGKGKCCDDPEHSGIYVEGCIEGDGTKCNPLRIKDDCLPTGDCDCPSGCTILASQTCTYTIEIPCCKYKVDDVDVTGRCLTVTFPENLTFDVGEGGFGFFGLQDNINGLLFFVFPSDEINPVGPAPTIQELLDAIENSFDDLDGLYVFTRLDSGFKICYTNDEESLILSIAFAGYHNQGFSPYLLTVNSNIITVGSEENYSLFQDFTINNPNNVFEVNINGEWIDATSDINKSGNWSSPVTCEDDITDWRILDGEGSFLNQGPVTKICPTLEIKKEGEQYQNVTDDIVSGVFTLQDGEGGTLFWKIVAPANTDIGFTITEGETEPVCIVETNTGSFCELIQDLQNQINDITNNFCDLVEECLPDPSSIECTVETGLTGCCTYRVENINLRGGQICVSIPEELTAADNTLVPGGGAMGNFEVRVGFDEIEENTNILYTGPIPPYTITRAEILTNLDTSLLDGKCTIEVNETGFCISNPLIGDIMGIAFNYISSSPVEGFCNGIEYTTPSPVLFEGCEYDTIYNIINTVLTFHVRVNNVWIDVTDGVDISGNWEMVSCNETVTGWKTLDANNNLVASGDVDIVCDGTEETKPICTWLQEHQTAIEELQTTPFIPTLQQVTDKGNTTDNDIEFEGSAGIFFDNGSRVTKGTTNAGNGGNGGVALRCSIDYQLKWEAGRLYVMEQDGFSIREVSYNFNITPTVNDDDTLGYFVGSRWILDDGDTYICSDATTGAAVWNLEPSVPLTAIAWDANHTTATGNPYLIGDIVYYSGNIYRCIANNDAIIPTNGLYWVNLGAGNPLRTTPVDWNATTGDNQILNKPTIPNVSGFVPYVSATQDVDLGTYKLTADAIAFDLNPTNAPDNGQIAYDGASGALAYKMGTSEVLSRIGQSMHAYVHNAEGVQINKGQVVYLFEASGNKASVKLALNTSDATSAKTFGLAAENIGAGQKGFVITQGVLEGLNTGMFNPGDSLYLGATAGSLTSTKPYAPNHMVFVGIVERANNGNGQIYVKPQNGYELDELHDVDLITTPPVNNDLLTYKTGANNLWKAQSLGTLLGGNTSQYVRGDGSLATFPTIPTQVSQLTNDSGYQTAAQVSTAITNAKLVQVVGIDGAATALTGAVTNGILGSVQIPANSMTTNTIVEFEAFLRKAAASAAPTHRVWINNANNLTGATQIALQTGASGNLMSKMERTFKVTSTGLTIYPTTASANIDDNVANAAPTNVAVTWSQNQWIIHTANNAVGETTTNEFLFVKKSAP